MLWLFLPFVVLLSGFIAYSADTIAKKVGRKHVRWFGLRPKTTALIVAVLAGMGISLVSLAAFILLNKNAIDIIAQADQLRPQIEELRREVRSVERELKNAEQQRDEAASQRELALKYLKSSRDELQAARLSQQQLLQQTTQLQAQVNELSLLRKTLEARAQKSRQDLADSKQALASSQERINSLDQQVIDLNLRSAQAILEGQQAEERAKKAQERAEAADRAAKAVTAQLLPLRQNAERLEREAREATAQRNRAEQERLNAQRERDRLNSERNALAAERAQAVQEREKAILDVNRLHKDLQTLRKQEQELRSNNTALAKQLASTRASLERLQDEYSSTRQELTISRNTELTYLKNERVYAGVVPSVRNLDAFLSFAATEAAQAGAKGNDGSPAARLSPAGRITLENSLRRLNMSGFVLCRAAQNSAAGFPVEMTCEAKPNVTLFRKGEVIRRLNVQLGGDSRSLQAQITELVQDTVLELTSRGVPNDYIDNQGLDASEYLTLLTRLGESKGRSIALGLAARDDVKPSTRVDLYPLVGP